MTRQGAIRREGEEVTISYGPWCVLRQHFCIDPLLCPASRFPNDTKASFTRHHDFVHASDTDVCAHCRPDDVFALFYGFLPLARPDSQAQQPAPDAAASQQSADQHMLASSNPHDKVTLFADLQHVADFAIAQFGPEEAEPDQQESWAAAVTENLTAALGGDCVR